MANSMTRPPRLNRIYLRDVLSFSLSRDQLEECRLVSRHVNATYNSYPLASWPREWIWSMSIDANEAPPEKRHLRDDGYFDTIDPDTDLDEMPKEWYSAECCADSDLRQLSRQLIGQKMYNGLGEEDLVEIRLTKYIENDDIHYLAAFNALNKMTEETAFGILHLMHHLRYVYFEEISLFNGRMKLNLEILRLASRLDYGFPCSLACNELSYFETKLHSSQLQNALEYIKFTGSIDADWLFAADIDEALKAIVTCGARCNRIFFSTREFTLETVDAIMEYLTCCDGLSTAIARVDFYGISASVWPTRCPRSEAMKRWRNNKAAKVYSYQLKCDTSGEMFKVHLIRSSGAFSYDIKLRLRVSQGMMEMPCFSSSPQ